ncbi:uncharacterized protein LOC131892948 isoform X2 [Tigriopus californicus]|uniref:uncharacterized protein LOC131892948 isoform X2 n=1 Tax=Tigriopus californicus TaxID=6832 RepID=UPI0027DA0340|nr:uncharacterized protein LOC131892948 isoform X2 [Tigriopus californicus]
MNDNDFIGCWRINDVLPTISGIDTELEIALKSRTFELTACHSLLWHDPQHLVGGPGHQTSLLLACTTFETQGFSRGRSAGASNPLLSLGGGNNLVVFAFKVSMVEPSTWEILLSPQSDVIGTTFKCTKIDNPYIRARESLPFDLRTAWEERSDLWVDAQIQSQGGLKKFQCHEIVLLSAFPSPRNELWAQLSGLSPSTLEIVLYYSYSQCFPDDLTGGNLALLIKDTCDRPALEIIHKRGQDLERIHGIGKDVSFLVEKIVHCANEILARLRRFHSRENDGALSKIRPEEYISTLQCSLKNGLRVVVFSSHLFHLYSTVERELELGERNSIIEFLESNIMSTFSTLRSIGSALKRAASELDFQTRIELDAQLIPEIVAFLQHVIHITSTIKTITKAVLDQKMSQVCSHSKRDLAQRVAWADLMTLQSFQDYITLLSKFVRNKLAFFTRMEQGTLLQYIDVLIQELVGELSLFNLRANNFLDVFTQRIHEGTFKFLAVTTAATLSHRLKEFGVWIRKETSLFEKLCLLMGDDPDFRASLVALGIGEMANKEQHPGHRRTQRPLIGALGSLKVCQAFFRPRPAAQSDLARNVAQRWPTEPATPTATPIGTRTATGDLTIVIVEPADGCVEQEFSCHRIILAARCPYFQRALTSGMKEQIEGTNALESSPMEETHRAGMIGWTWTQR